MNSRGMEGHSAAAQETPVAEVVVPQAKLFKFMLTKLAVGEELVIRDVTSNHLVSHCLTSHSVLTSALEDPVLVIVVTTPAVALLEVATTPAVGVSI